MRSHQVICLMGTLIIQVIKHHNLTNLCTSVRGINILATADALQNIPCLVLIEAVQLFGQEHGVAVCLLELVQQKTK